MNENDGIWKQENKKRKDIEERIEVVKIIIEESGIDVKNYIMEKMIEKGEKEKEEIIKII